MISPTARTVPILQGMHVLPRLLVSGFGASVADAELLASTTSSVSMARFSSEVKRIFGIIVRRRLSQKWILSREVARRLNWVVVQVVGSAKGAEGCVGDAKK